jgi:hypothetical protein
MKKMVGCVGNAPTRSEWTAALQATRDLYAANNPKCPRDREGMISRGPLGNWKQRHQGPPTLHGSSCSLTAGRPLGSLGAFAPGHEVDENWLRRLAQRLT